MQVLSTLGMWECDAAVWRWKEEKYKEGNGCQYLHPTKYQRQEALFLVIGKRSKVMSTKLRVRSRTKRTKNNEFSIGTWEMRVMMLSHRCESVENIGNICLGLISLEHRAWDNPCSERVRRKTDREGLARSTMSYCTDEWWVTALATAL